MKIGTRSLLFGVHQVLWHPYTVLRAWIHLYGCPSWRELFCIVIHDWGYWGRTDMDGPSGRHHPCLGMRIASRVLGPEWGMFVYRHSRNLCAETGLEPSKLCWADKYSMLYDPQWFYLLRARLSGEIKEYRQRADLSGFCDADYPDWAWHLMLTRKLARMAEKQAKS